MDPQKLFEQVRDLYDQLALPLTKEQAAHFLGLIADDADRKASTLQNEVDAAAEEAEADSPGFYEVDDEDDDPDPDFTDEDEDDEDDDLIWMDWRSDDEADEEDE